MMSHSQFWEEYRRRMAKKSSERPSVISGRRFVFVVTLIWGGTRILQILSQILCGILGSLNGYSFHGVAMIPMIIFYLLALYFGLRFAVIFPVFTGSIFIFETFKYGFYYISIAGDYGFDAHICALASIVAAYAQVICSILLVIDPHATFYFKTVRKIVGNLDTERMQEKYEQKKNKKNKQ